MYNPLLGPFKILGTVAFVGIIMGFGFSAMKKNSTDQSGQVIDVQESIPAIEPSRVTEVVFTDTSCNVSYNYGGVVGDKNIKNINIESLCDYDGMGERTQDELNCLAYACLKK